MLDDALADTQSCSLAHTRSLSHGPPDSESLGQTPLHNTAECQAVVMLDVAVADTHPNPCKSSVTQSSRLSVPQTDTTSQHS